MPHCSFAQNVCVDQSPRQHPFRSISADCMSLNHRENTSPYLTCLCAATTGRILSVTGVSLDSVHGVLSFHRDCADPITSDFFPSVSVICLPELHNLVTCFRKLSHSDAGKPPISITLKRKVMTAQKRKEGCSKSSALKRTSALLPPTRRPLQQAQNSA